LYNASSLLTYTCNAGRQKEIKKKLLKLNNTKEEEEEEEEDEFSS